MSDVFDALMMATRDYITLPILKELDADSEPRLYYLTLTVLIILITVVASIFLTLVTGLIASSDDSSTGKVKV